MKRDWRVAVYGPMKQKTYDTSLFDLIRTEFGYIGGPEIVSLFVRKIVELNEKYYLPEHYVKPGQMRWLAVRADEKYSMGKSMRNMKLIPVTLTVVNEEDIDDYCKGVSRKEMLQRFIDRIHKETRDQGGVLPETDAGVMMRLAHSTISVLISEYENTTKKTIPRCGTDMDIGRTLTHKKLAFHNFKKKMTTTENAKSIDHSPEAVDRYIKDGTRVEVLYNAGYNAWDIAHITALSISLVNEYIEIIKEHNQKKDRNNKNKINEQQAK